MKNKNKINITTKALVAVSIGIPLFFILFFLFFNFSDITYEASFYTRAAVEKENIKLCNFIESGLGKGICYREVFEVTNNINICEENIFDQRDKDLCYYHIAKVEKDTTLCDKIVEQKTKDSCYHNVAKGKKDATICDKIVGQKTKDGCYQAVALVTQNTTFCYKIVEQRLKDRCYTQ